MAVLSVYDAPCETYAVLTVVPARSAKLANILGTAPKRKAGIALACLFSQAERSYKKHYANSLNNSQLLIKVTSRVCTLAYSLEEQRMLLKFNLFVIDNKNKMT